MYKKFACIINVLLSCCVTKSSDALISIKPYGTFQKSSTNILTTLLPEMHWHIAALCPLKTLLALRATDKVMHQLWIVDLTKLQNDLFEESEDTGHRIVVDLECNTDNGTLKNEKTRTFFKLLTHGSLLQTNHSLTFQNMNEAGFFIFCRNFNLPSLYLGYTCLTGVAVTTMSYYLQNNLWPQLKELNLIFTRIGEENEIKTLAKSLIHNTTLTNLNLSCNSICSIGMSALGKSLEQNTTLQELNLDYNSEGEPRFTELIKSLQHNTSLKKLCINGHFMNDEEKRLIKQSEMLRPGLISYGYYT